MKLVDFKIPKSLDEAQSVLKQLGPSALPIAGATSLVFTGGKDEKVAVDITRIGLEGIRRQNGTFRIGAATRLSVLQQHREDGWVLDRVAKHVASQQVRNVSTIGGNVVRVFPWADFPVALLALDAQFVIAGDSERTVKADEFFSGQPVRLLKPGELLAAVCVPAVWGFGYHKETRAAMGFSVMTAAACLEADGKRIKRARVVVGAGVPFPSRIEAAEKALVGQAASEDLFKEAAAKGVQGLKMKTAVGNSDEYTAHLAAVVVCDAIAKAWAEAARK